MNDLAIQTVARNFATKLVLWALGVGAGVLVTHGYATEDQVRQIMDPLGQIIVGGVMTVGGLVLAWVRAQQKRRREISLANAQPAQVAVK